MTKRRFTPVETNAAAPEIERETKPRVNDGSSQATMFRNLFLIACAAVLVLAYFAFFSGSTGGSAKSGADGDVQAILGKTYVELGNKYASIPDPEDQTTKVTYWRFSDMSQRWGFCSVITMPEPYPNMLMITDAGLKITKIKNMNEFSQAGADKRAEYTDVMNRYEGRSLTEFSYLESSPDEGAIRQFREILRDSLAKALKVMYINEYGMDSFKANFPQGIKFSKVGTKLEPWRVTTEDGKEIGSGNFEGRKYAFLSASACGSCRAKITEIAQDMKTKGGMKPDQIVIIFTGKPEEKAKIKDMLAGEYLVLDPDSANFCKMISFTEGSPSMMLVDSKGIVVAKENSRGLEDEEAKNKTLESFYNNP